MPPKKKNAYTYYVEERCRGTGRHYSQSFHVYSHDWEALSVADKEKYFKMAAANRSNGDKKPAGILTSSSMTSQVFGESSKGAHSILKMSNVIQDVNHNVGEFLEGRSDPGKYYEAPYSADLAKEFHDIVAQEYADIQTQKQMQKSLAATGTYLANMLDVILIVSCIPVCPMDNNLTSINRPIEIAVEGFKIGGGHLRQTLFHEFIDPGQLPAGSLLGVTSARRKYHQIPAASFIKTDEACEVFHEGYKLNSDYYSIYRKLVTLAGFASRPRMLPFLTGDGDPATTRACLTWLWERAMVQADEEELADLPPLLLSTVTNFMANVLQQMNLKTMDSLETVRNTYYERRYHHHVELRCPFHQDVESELCAMGTACDQIYCTFDIFRSFGFELPADGLFAPPSTEE